MARGDERKAFEDRERTRELIRRCAASRSQRRVLGDQLTNWYESGSDGLPRAKYNKLHSHIDRVASFVFAPNTVRFSGHLPVAVRKPWLGALGVVRDELRQTWEGEPDAVAALLLEWALVLGATIAKVQHDPTSGGFKIGFIQPWDFGVIQEDVADLGEQHTVCHWYTASVPQVEEWVSGEDGAARLTALAREHQRTGPGATSMQRLVIASVTGVFPSGTISAGFPMQPPESIAERPGAAVLEPTVEFVDVWEKKIYRRHRASGEPDEFRDWRVSTFIADSQQHFISRRNPDLPWTRTPYGVLPPSLPFAAMVPRPLPDYFWGRSELSDLRQLQNWLEDHLGDIRVMIKKKLDPAKFYVGIPDFEEAGRALGMPGGAYGSPEPTAKATPIEVNLGPEPFQVLSNILSFFADASGIPESLQEPGQMSGGIRATGHFAMAAGVGAGRIRRMALVVEQTLGELATLAYQILQRHDTHAYERSDGPPFLLSQLPVGVTMRVDAHSSAPIFAEQTQAKAVILKRMNAIGNEDAVELIDPPGREELKAKAIERDRAAAEHSKEMLAIQAAKATKSGRPPRAQ